MTQVLLWYFVQSRSQTQRKAWVVRVFLNEDDVGHGAEDEKMVETVAVVSAYLPRDLDSSPISSTDLMCDLW